MALAFIAGENPDSFIPRNPFQQHYKGITLAFSGPFVYRTLTYALRGIAEFMAQYALFTTVTFDIKDVTVVGHGEVRKTSALSTFSSDTVPSPFPVAVL